MQEIIQIVPDQVWNSGPAIIAAVVIFAAEGFFLWWIGRLIAPFARDFLANQKSQTDAMTAQSAAITKLVAEMGLKKEEDETSHRRILLTLKVIDSKLEDLMGVTDTRRETKRIQDVEET